MIDSFYIGAYWGSRAESLSTVSRKIQEILILLNEVDEQFLSWYELGMSRKEALKYKVSIDDVNIKRLCLQKVRNGELNDKGYSKNGFLFGLWTGHKDEEASTISFNVGSEFKSMALCNSCVLKIPFEGDAHERLLNIEKVKAIVSVLQEIWNPDYAVLTSHRLNNKLEVINEIGWITYRRSIKKVPKLGGEIIHERTANDGHLFYPKSSINNYDLLNELIELKRTIL